MCINNMRKTALLTALLLMVPILAQATPSVTGWSGDAQHGESITIQGSGFGVKNPAGPILWDDFATGILGEVPLSPTIGPNWNSSHSGASVRYSDTVERVAGGKTARADFQTAGNYRSSIGLVGGPWGSLYVSVWYRSDYGNLTAYNGNPSRNQKIFRIEGNNGTKSGDQGEGVPLVAYEKLAVDNFFTSTRAQYSPDFIGENVSGSSTDWNNEQWDRVELYLNVIDGQKDFVRWEGATNTTPSKDLSWWTDTWSPHMGGDNSRFNELFFGFYFSRDNGASAYVYIDEVYVSTTPARIEIGNASTWGACAHREIQIPSEWSSTSITTTVNRGSFGPTDTAYLYVVDSDGTVNSAGYAITFGDTATDTTPPVRGGGYPSGELAYGTTSITAGLDTDEAATCRWSTSTGVAYASMADTFSTTGGVSHSQSFTGLSDGGSYAVYVRCIDSSDNANVDDYTIAWTVAEAPQPPPEYGTFSWQHSSYQVARSDGYVYANIVRTGGSEGAVSVQWSSNGVTALHNVDYYGADNQTTNFADGETVKSIYAYEREGIELIDNGASEGRYFELILSNAQGGADIGSPNKVDVTILATPNPISAPSGFRVGGGFTWQ